MTNCTKNNMKHYGSLNHLFSSWVNLGKPDDFVMKHHYLEADGHTTYCCNTMFVDNDSLPDYIKIKLGNHQALASATKKGLIISYNPDKNMNYANPLIRIALVEDYPNGYFEPIFTARNLLKLRNQ